MPTARLQWLGVAGKPTKEAQHAEAGQEALLGMWPLHGDHFRARLEALRRPCGVAQMRARQVVRIRAVTQAAVARRWTAVREHLDGAFGDARIVKRGSARVAPKKP
jgi:hypothetical protein